MNDNNTKTADIIVAALFGAVLTTVVWLGVAAWSGVILR